MAANLLNCWEVMGCGRQAGGGNAPLLGVCPAASDATYDGLNHGRNGGRICWAVAGTFCNGTVQGTFAEKRPSCVSCEFFQKVQREEEEAGAPSRFFHFVSDDTMASLMGQFGYRHVKAGARFLAPGDPGEQAFIIQKGTCLVLVEKSGVLLPADHRGRGDIVGLRSLLTGEPRNDYVEAETDMDLWVLSRNQFDLLLRREPALFSLLSELVVRRFDSKRPIANRVIGKYVLTEIIGRGGYGIIYKGRHLALNMPIAVKMMRHHFFLDSDYLDSFRTEAKIIASLNHQNILKVYDIEEQFQTFFMITEYLEGESLRAMIDRLTKLPAELAMDFLVQACAGLEYAHRRNIVHRDINPANLVIEKNNVVKILDFGLACPFGTEDCQMGGAIAYLAPELFEGEPADQRSDIYALGVTAFEMVTGRRPFPDDCHRTLMEMACSQEIPDPADFEKNLPGPFRRFIRRACRRDPEKRYQSMSEALAELRPAAGSRADSFGSRRRELTSLFMLYDAEQRPEVEKLVDEFARKAEKFGVDLKKNDLGEVV